MSQTCILSIIASLLINTKAQPTTLSPWPELECPDGTTQIGSLNADIAGCGLDGCDKRYQDHYKTIEDCVIACNKNDACISFTWAPLNGDKNHPGKTVCTLYDSKEPNQQWAPQQIMCASAPLPRLPAEVTLHCDNIGTLEISYDHRETFTVVSTEDDWTIPIRASIHEASQDTVLRLTCEDQGVVGGFIASVKYDGIYYSTSEPINDGYWKLISSSDGDTSSLVYSSKNSEPWYINTENIEQDAVWIWNGYTYNTMVFEFDFKNVISGKMPYNIITCACNEPLTKCGNLQYSVLLKWVVVMGFMLMVSVLMNVYMCYTTQRKAAFAHTLVEDCDEVEGKSTDIVSV